MAKNLQEQIRELEEKQAQLEAKKKDLLSKQKVADRKARSHRLIEVGSILEKAVGIEFSSKEMRNALSEALNKKRLSNGKEITIGEWIAELFEKEKASAVSDSSVKTPDVTIIKNDGDVTIKKDIY